MENYNNDPLMNWILEEAKNYINKKKTLIPDQEKMNIFLDAHNKIKKLCEDCGYEFSLSTEHLEISPCNVILKLEMDYFGTSELTMDEVWTEINNIMSNTKSFDISSTDDGFLISIVFDVYTVE